MDFSTKIAAIHLLSIEKNNQFKGNGTLLINSLKSISKKEDLRYIIVFADNSAIEFFEKNGFQKRKEISLNTFKKVLGSYTFSKAMEYKINFKANNEINTLKYDQKSISNIRNENDLKLNFEEKLILLKNNVSIKLDNLSQDKHNYIGFNLIEALKNNEFFFEIEDPIDLNTIKINIFDKKYKNKNLIFEDLKKAINIMKIYYKNNNKELNNIIMTENEMNKIIEFIENF